ncbi:MAG TPA: hypothetical protein VMY43_01645 [Methanothrix sp.]|nr:hypothetical protein [Methanothrix sp.]
MRTMKKTVSACSARTKNSAGRLTPGSKEHKGNGGLQAQIFVRSRVGYRIIALDLPWPAPEEQQCYG